MNSYRLTFENATTRVTVRVELDTEKKPCAPGLTIDLEPVPGGTYTELSITGDVYEKSGHRWREVAGGQIHEELLERFGDDPYVARLVEIWKRWHLNGLRAGTRAQADFLREHPVNAVYPASHYDLALEALTAAGLNPDRDYKYGKAWLVELLPDELVAELTDRSFARETSVAAR